MKETPIKTVLSIREVARRLGIAHSSVQYHIKAGHVRTVPMGVGIPFSEIKKLKERLNPKKILKRP